MQREGEDAGRGGALGGACFWLPASGGDALHKTWGKPDLRFCPAPRTGPSIPLPCRLRRGNRFAGVGPVAASAVAAAMRWSPFAPHVSAVPDRVYVVVRVRHWMLPWKLVVDCVSAEPACEPESLAFALERVR